MLVESGMASEVPVAEGVTVAAVGGATEWPAFPALPPALPLALPEPPLPLPEWKSLIKPFGAANLEPRLPL